MRTLRAGIDEGRRVPMAFLPYCIEAVVAGVLLLVGLLPASPASAPATGLLSFTTYHDVKQSLAFGSAWSWVAAAVALGVVTRSLVLAATIWLAEGARGPLIVPWARALRVAVVAALAFVPVAGLHFVGAAIRYAPFTWVAGILGVAVALVATRKAIGIDAGTGVPPGRGLPSLGALLAYGYLFSLTAAGLWAVSGSDPWVAAVVLACLGPVNAAIVLGWRAHVRSGTPAEPAALVLTVTALGIVALLLVSLYDRYVVDTTPVPTTERQDATLFILGGADSTSETGAVARFDARDVGLKRNGAVHLSYTAVDSYEATDTHKDPGDIAREVSEQIAGREGGSFLLGHSQSAIIVDHLLARAASVEPAGGWVEREVSVSGPPPYPPFWPPRLVIPPSGDDGPGAPAGELARWFSDLLDRAGLEGFDIDAAAAPTNLDAVVPCTNSACPVPRMNVWALGDSVWLDRDWRRPGETNIIVLSDHVGAVKNGRTIEAIREFFTREEVPDDEGPSWEGTLVHVLRFAFEPWRPGR